MERFLHLLVVLGIVACISGSSAEEKEKSLSRNNTCTKIGWYQENVTVPVTTQVKEYYKTWCFNIPPVCETYRYKNVTQNKIMTKYNTKITYECCKGYEEVDGDCSPICDMPCVHGECIAPDVCACDKGWMGSYCGLPCKLWHSDSQECGNKYCFCTNGGSCNHEDGSCICPKGFMGKHCENSCPANRYGINCQDACECQNEAECDSQNGTCICNAGYFGEKCENKCEPGKHGVHCKMTCECFNETTESCSHIDGKCHCKPGWTGELCEKECDNFRYGPDCSLKCICSNSDFCDRISGECICKPGWMGAQCSEACPEGRFGEECLLLCNCPNKSMKCHPENGACFCPEGKIGDNCEETCKEGFWGLNCSEVCTCPKKLICSSETGECNCPSGWMGEDCLKICPFGFYGLNCLNECNCIEEICDPFNGSCNCIFDSTGIHCGEQHHDLLSSSDNSKIIIAIIVSAVIVMLVLCGFCIFYNRNCEELPQKIIPKKPTSPENNSSIDSFSPYFENPVYSSSDFENVNIGENVDNTPSGTVSRNSEGFQRVMAYLQSIRFSALMQEKDSEKSVQNIQDKDQKNEIKSDLGRQTLNDLSSLETRNSGTYGTIQKPNVCSHVPVDEIEKGYEPETLSEFKIPEDSINQNGKPAKPEKLEKQEAKDPK